MQLFRKCTVSRAAHTASCSGSARGNGYWYRSADVVDGAGVTAAMLGCKASTCQHDGNARVLWCVVNALCCFTRYLQRRSTWW